MGAGVASVPVIFPSERKKDTLAGKNTGTNAQYAAPERFVAKREKSHGAGKLNAYHVDVQLVHEAKTLSCCSRI
jgi:hypothetical protein